MASVGVNIKTASYVRAEQAYQKALAARAGFAASKMNHTQVISPQNTNLINQLNAVNTPSIIQQSVISGQATGNFADFFEKVTRERLKKLRRAEEQTALAIRGDANAIEVMSAIAESEAALQELVTVRDKIINAYQEVIRMAL